MVCNAKIHNKIAYYDPPPCSIIIQPPLTRNHIFIYKECVFVCNTPSNLKTNATLRKIAPIERKYFLSHHSEGVNYYVAYIHEISHKP